MTKPESGVRIKKEVRKTYTVEFINRAGKPFDFTEITDKEMTDSEVLHYAQQSVNAGYAFKATITHNGVRRHRVNNTKWKKRTRA